jgi:hypothetical protein
MPWSQSQADHLPTNLAPEHDELNGRTVAVTPTQAYQIEDPDEGRIEKRQSHGSISFRSRFAKVLDQGIRMTFLAATPIAGLTSAYPRPPARSRFLSRRSTQFVTTSWVVLSTSTTQWPHSQRGVKGTAAGQSLGCPKWREEIAPWCRYRSHPWQYLVIAECAARTCYQG